MTSFAASAPSPMDISELEQEESRSPMSVDVADGHSNATPHNASADSLEGPARAWNEPATPITNPVRPRLPKLKVVLDLDETLLHCKINPGTSAAELGCHSMARSGVAQGNGTQTSRMVEELAVRLEDPNRQLVRVFKRPGVDEFLRLASEKYDLYAFTASESFYARPLLRLLDPNGTIFKKQFYRDTCKLFRDGIFAKDLHCIFGSAEEEGAGLVDPLSRVVLVDNNPLSFIPQPSNGVPIVSWYDSPDDTALTVLMDFLQKLDVLRDVRPFLKETFHLNAAINNYFRNFSAKARQAENTTTNATAVSTPPPKSLREDETSENLELHQTSTQLEAKEALTPTHVDIREPLRQVAAPTAST